MNFATGAFTFKLIPTSYPSSDLTSVFHLFKNKKNMELEDSPVK